MAWRWIRKEHWMLAFSVKHRQTCISKELKSFSPPSWKPFYSCFNTHVNFCFPKVPAASSELKWLQWFPPLCSVSLTQILLKSHSHRHCEVTHQPVGGKAHSCVTFKPCDLLVQVIANWVGVSEHPSFVNKESCLAELLLLCAWVLLSDNKTILVSNKGAWVSSREVVMVDKMKTHCNLCVHFSKNKQLKPNKNKKVFL